METLTERQQDILAFIRAYRDQRGFSPTYREIGAEVGLGSPSSVEYQLNALAGKGWLRLNPGTTRAIVVLDPAEQDSR